MLLFVPKESCPAETRVPAVPETVKKLVSKGAEIVVEAGIGQTAGYRDDEYAAAGAQVTSDRAGFLAKADLVWRLNKPSLEDAKALKKGAIHISYLEPFGSPELLDTFIAAGVSAISIEMLPRTTLAQKMDALSSQANLAGYKAVIIAAERLAKALPMMMTPAGTIKPARVFIIGCGVAGLQAIATAKRLGARVEAFDTRPVVEEQVHSLGAKFVKIDLGETGQTQDGYAKELTDEQKAMQREAMAKVLAQSDMVITTAQVFGRKAPVIVTLDMVKSMRPGSVVVDLAVDTGGNVEGVVPGEETMVNGVRVVGIPTLSRLVPVPASEMYSANIGNLIDHFWDKESKRMKLNLEDAIIQGCLVVHDGELRNEMLKKARSGS